MERILKEQLMSEAIVHAEARDEDRANEILFALTVDDYLHDLELNWDQLRRKKVLDIGAGLCRFTKAAIEHDAQVFSLDRETDNYQPINVSFAKEIPFVKGDALMLPFRDNSFDLIISRATFDNSTPDLSGIFQEVKRVLFSLGEFHFTLSSKSLLANLPFCSNNHTSTIREIRLEEPEIEVRTLKDSLFPYLFILRK